LVRPILDLWLLLGKRLHFRMHPLFEHQAGVGVSEVVETHMWQPGVLNDLRKGVRVWADRWHGS